MQGFKKSLVALLLVAAMVLTAIVPAFAATEPAKKEVLSDAAARLIALGIVKGDDKGKVNEDQPVTRAEAAAMVVRALNMETAADLQKGQTKFADVNADAGLQWATGIINVAVSQGIINGYPDGRFDGRGNVTYAQFAKMLVYALNYGVTVEGGVWPTAVLAKADELGLTKKVSVVADAPMTRGAVIRMVDNALTVPTLKQTGYGDVSIYDPTGETLLAKLGLDELEGRIIEVPQVAKGLAKNQVTMYVEKVNGETDEDEDDRIKSNETLDVIEGADAQGYFGLKVIAWVNDDDEILYVQQKTKDTDVLVDVADEFKSNDKVTLLVADKDYKFRKESRTEDEATIYINDEKVDLKDFLEEGKKGKSGKYEQKIYGRFVKDGDEIVFAYLFDFDKTGVITKVDDNGFEYFDKGGNTRKIRFADYDDVIFLTPDLKIGSIDDLEVDGVAYWYEDTDDDELYLVASPANKVKGKLDRVREDEMYIDGKKYKAARPLGAGGVTVSSNDNEDIERWMDGENLADEVEDLTGTDVIALLDIVGRVRHVVGDSEAGSGDQYGVATDAYQTGREYMIRIMGKDGKEVAYPVEKRGDWDPYRKYFEEYFNEEGAPNDTPYLPVKYKLSGDGEVKEDELFLVAGPVGPFAEKNWSFASDNSKATFADKITFKVASDELFYGEVFEFDDDDDYIEIKEGSRKVKHYVESKTVLMNMALDGSDWDDPEALEWDDIESKNIPDDVWAVGYNLPDAKLVVFVKNFDDVVDDEEFGVTVEKPTYDGSDWWIKVDVAGEGITEYKIDDKYGKGKDAFAKGHLVGFTVNSSGKLTPAKFDEDRDGRGPGHVKGEPMWFTRSKTDVQKAVRVIDDGDYLELETVAGKYIGKFKIAKDAVVYDLDKEYDLDKKLDYTDVDVDDYILFLEDESDIIRAVLIVSKCYDKGGKTPETPVEGGEVTYVNAAEGLIEVNGKVLELDKRVRLVDAKGNTVTIGPKAVAAELKVGMKVKVTDVDGVVTEIKLLDEEPGSGEEPEELTAEAEIVYNALVRKYLVKVKLSDSSKEVESFVIDGVAYDVLDVKDGYARADASFDQRPAKVEVYVDGVKLTATIK